MISATQVLYIMLLRRLYATTAVIYPHPHPGRSVRSIDKDTKCTTKLFQSSYSATNRTANAIDIVPMLFKIAMLPLS